MKCFNGECHTQKLNECLVFDDKKECRHFISESEQTTTAPVDSQSAGSAVCCYTETLQDEDKCGKPATHYVSKPERHKMLVCAEHAKLYDRPAFDGARYIIEPNDLHQLPETNEGE